MGKAGEYSSAMLTVLMLTAIFASLSYAEDQKVRVRVPGIT